MTEKNKTKLPPGKSRISTSPRPDLWEVRTSIAPSYLGKKRYVATTKNDENHVLRWRNLLVGCTATIYFSFIYFLYFLYVIITITIATTPISTISTIIIITIVIIIIIMIIIIITITIILGSRWSSQMYANVSLGCSKWTMAVACFTRLKNIPMKRACKNCPMQLATLLISQRYFGTSWLTSAHC